MGAAGAGMSRLRRRRRMPCGVDCTPQQRWCLRSDFLLWQRFCGLCTRWISGAWRKTWRNSRKNICPLSTDWCGGQMFFLCRGLLDFDDAHRAAVSGFLRGIFLFRRRLMIDLRYIFIVHPEDLRTYTGTQPAADTAFDHICFHRASFL